MAEPFVMKIELLPDAMEKFGRVAELVEAQVAEAIAQDMRRTAPVLTGDLKNSITVEGNGITVSSDHWLYVEYGTKPHPIIAGKLQTPPKPGGKKALWWPGAARPVPSVRHPGTPEQPFIRPSVYRARRLAPVNVV